MSQANVKAVPLYGDAYQDSKTLKAALYHAVDVGNTDWKALCGGPSPDHLMDDDCVWKDVSAVTCKRCLKKLNK